MLLGLQNATFEFGARTIFEDATWHIHPNERIGLIGYNGTGKSTLLKVLTGQYSLSKGTVEKGRETTIGFLHQDLLSFDTEESIFEVAKSAFGRVLEVERELEAIGKELETNATDELGIKYAELLNEMDVLDGYSVDHKTEQVLQGLGFSNADVKRPYKEFSGGWRMRVLLAKMILMAPDVLLLDEPTNHLDLPSIEWLEKYLIHYKGAVVIVSHDRFFLDRMVNKVVEIYQQELHIYSGNYTYYQTEKLLRIEMQKRAFENQQDYIRQQERVVERFKAKASKAAMAQSIVKKLDKLERIEDTNLERPNIKINFSIGATPGKIICTLKNIAKNFGDNHIIKNGQAEINRGDKIALIGANGKGKSTLLRIVAGTEQHAGTREWGHNVKESFYAQHQIESLNIENPILEEMERAGSGKTTLELRSLLGCFLFGGEEVDKKIKVLSGGEKARVALAKVIVSKANFLMLDEPTNHLDMHSVELLVEALNKYEGSLILVSHDRYFVSKTANKIWEISDYEIKEFNGGYDEWMAWKERMEANGGNNKKEPTETKTQPVVTKPEATKQEEAPAKGAVIDKELKKEINKVKNRFTQVEEKLAQLNSKKKTLETDLGDPTILTDRTKFVLVEKQYNDNNLELEVLNAEYENLFEKIMALEDKA
jgi:ATP-binding cassette, subfamily F, member 3